jgi:ribose-phosphate pyrophosphokinase
MILVSGSAHPALASEAARRLGVPLAACVLERFPDGELHVELRESVRGRKVFLFQPTSPPVEQHLFELLMLADACRRAGARERIAVMPYFGYARQDRRAKGREPIGARVVCDVLAAGGLTGAVVLDLHSRAAEGFFAMPTEHVSALSLLGDAIHTDVGENAVVVAPDLGAVRLANRCASRLECPVAIVYKTRLTGRDVKVQQIVGDVRDRVPFIVDDMISTGGTVAAAVRALLAAGCRPDLTVVATHGVFTDLAAETLRALPIGRIVTTDSVAPRMDLGLPVQVVSVAPLLAEVIARLDRDESLGDLVTHSESR